jgi:hypothetical protein
MSGDADQCVLRHRLSFSPKLQQEEAHSTVEQPKANAETPSTHHPSSSMQLQPVQHQEDGKDKPSEEQISWEEGKLIFNFDHS